MSRGKFFLALPDIVPVAAEGRGSPSPTGAYCSYGGMWAWRLWIAWGARLSQIRRKVR